jgi:hypothetical protein
VNGTGHVSEPERITWPKRFDASTGALDADARLCLINDLGLLRAPWCVPLLEQASREERDPAHRNAVQRALLLCRPRAVSSSADPKPRGDC